ncbi:ABC transporter ATP-binding protein [Chitiniphilus eburneus]|uniref:ABC transporter ATP-binding protein n=1 Tax=Chitiniphilus eburneus TaxID=2571148 RepID=A0A4U0Q837_9NEIS|nr:ABC transporter ATP-binding protein [Chitiniphilus eburneus]TJZ77399.1 ABC transporter ATP-binding protein [Chitiniphilus eburneus]
MTTAIELVRLKKTYRAGWRKTKVALDDLSLSVQPGEAFGFIGANGAGKSTTIKALMGLLAPDEGGASLFGIPALQPRARQRVAYVPESPILFDQLTPLELMDYGCAYHGVRKPSMREHCLSWLARFGLEEVANKPIRGFSKGMTQRAALAHALAIEPRLLVLDEPLSGLDPVGRKLVMDVMGEFHAAGGTLFFSSHVLYDVQRLADRFGIIHQGRLRALGNLSELEQAPDTALQLRIAGENAPTQATPLGAGEWLIEVQQNDLWNILDTCRERGMRVVELRPRLDLEQFFNQLVEAPIADQ